MTICHLAALACVLTSSCTAAELYAWRATAPEASSGIQLLKNNKPGWTLSQSAAGAFAAIKPSNDFYHRATFAGRLPSPAPEGAWLTVSFLDQGYGLISLDAGGPRRTGRNHHPGDQWGFVRLNTGKIRRAVFPLPAGASEVHLAGVKLLSALTVTATKPAYEELPVVEPALKLKVRMNLVTTAGADATTVDQLPEALARMKQTLPLVKALGFNGVESYVKWNFVERSPGVFDWSYYDAVVAECAKYGLKWFPLLIVGSSYSMPEWFHDSAENVSYECLEHHLKVDIPTIFYDGQVKYVKRFLNEFGKHYGNNPSLLGIRLGPSANYGEAQYPATGNWGYKGQFMHTHIGYWAADPYASVEFRKWLKERYPSIADLNKAWGGTTYASFDAVKTFLPITALNDRMRQDFSTWYLNAMSDWCGKWATWAREAMPNATIYQSSGGWGAVDIGTDYIAQAKTMGGLHGGIRLTNENDSYVNNFSVTRPAASAARFYGAMFGTEPAGFSSRRGVMNRLYNIITNDGQHLFYYDGNLYSNDGAADAWLKYAPLLDQKAQPMMDVAVFYPDTANKLSDSIMRYLDASSFFSAAHKFRSVMDYDFMGEQMIRDGALSRYKVLVFLAGRVTEKPVLERIDQWVKSGGIVIIAARQGSAERPLATVEGDGSTYQGWRKGGTGKGRVIFYDWHPDLTDYCKFLAKELSNLPQVRKPIRDAIKMQKPETVFWSVLSTGKLALLNYGDNAADVRLTAGTVVHVEPYTIEMR